MSEKMDEKSQVSQFDELPDAPPKSMIRLSWIGRISVAIVAAWVFLAIFGPWVAPWAESHFIEEDAQGNYFLDPGLCYLMLRLIRIWAQIISGGMCCRV